MGQVPSPSSGIVYGIVGDGRLARHFAHYFNFLKIPYRQWSRSLQSEQGTTAHAALQDCQTILVMISDSAIEPWIENFCSVAGGSGSQISGKKFVHFSGALVTPLATGVHPLMTFGKSFYELAQYEAIPFVCEKAGPGFKEIFPKLGNPHYAIEASEKPFYHALCVMSGNFTVLLWQKMFADLEKKLGIPAKAAVPYLEQVARNLRTDSAHALTGPLARGDKKTIQKNLESLENDPFKKVYEAFVEAHQS